MNIRLTPEEIEDLEQIALREDRDRSYLVAWFTRWAMHHYESVGSLLELQETKLVSPAQATPSEILDAAKERLKLRRRAKEEYDKNSGKVIKKSA